MLAIGLKIGPAGHRITLSTGLSGSLVPSLPQPPTGYIFLTDKDGAYLVDPDGAYLMETI